MKKAELIQQIKNVQGSLNQLRIDALTDPEDTDPATSKVRDALQAASLALTIAVDQAQNLGKQ